MGHWAGDVNCPMRNPRAEDGPEAGGAGGGGSGQVAGGAQDGK